MNENVIKMTNIKTKYMTLRMEVYAYYLVQFNINGHDPPVMGGTNPNSIVGKPSNLILRKLPNDFHE